jgi:predicted small secreted protein
MRKKLADDNQFLKYTRYAIGEILLVMIGILLALQVNNWNNVRSDRALEVKYLNGIKADLQVDLVNLKTFIDDKELKFVSAAALLEMDSPQTITDLDAMDSILWNVFGWVRYDQSTNTLDELIGSGNLSLIKNDSIKKMIQNVKQSNISIQGSVEHMRREYDYYLYDRSAALREMAPLIDLSESVKQRKRIMNTNLDKAKLKVFKEQSHAILNDLIFRNGLKLAIGNNVGVREDCLTLYADVEKLIGFINEELDEQL